MEIEFSEKSSIIHHHILSTQMSTSPSFPLACMSVFVSVCTDYSQLIIKHVNINAALIWMMSANILGVWILDCEG